jgi:hypothetical protein
MLTKPNRAYLFFCDMNLYLCCNDVVNGVLSSAA